MSGQKIEVVIDEDANTSVEAFGYKNGECRDATRAIEKALGSVVDRDIKSGDCKDVKKNVKIGS